MSVRIALALLAGLGVASPAAAQRSYVVQRFDAVIRVNPDASIDVTETIAVRFTGSWNGVFRTVPVKYRTPQGLNWTLGLKLESVTDADGRALRVESSRERHYAKFKIWVPNAANAVRTVVLRYRATNGLRFFDEHDELYWNVTGDEWEVPIEAATARIELPPGAAGVRAIAFNGAYGSVAREAAVEMLGTAVRIAMPHAMGRREGLTAVVGWDKGLVAQPSALARAVGVLASNWPLGLPLAVFAAAFAIWRRRGRDPRRRPVSVRYEPPPGLSPAEAGTLIDNAADLRDITATLVDLAVRGYLRFEERDERALFGLIGGRTYVLHRLDPSAGAAPLAPHEQIVFDGVFSGRGTAVKLSDLEDEFYSEISKIRSSIFDRLVGHGFYGSRPDHVRSWWMAGALLFGTTIAIGGSVAAGRFLLTPVPFIMAGVLSAAILLVFAAIMPARTEAGARALEQVLGFEEFLERVEAEHLKRVIIGHPEMFDRFLPYAMAFGVEKKWARAFEGLYTEAPRWYVGSSLTHFSVTHLSSSLAGFTTAAGSTMTSSPRSSSGSGFGGSSGGGGFSGGGGGGGGGGAF